jgi:c-di-GMP-binding flagellar brake protein YcgR
MSDSDNLSGMGAGDMSVDWRDRAREFRKEGKFDLALDLFRKGYDQFPYDDSCLREISGILLCQNRIDEAISLYQCFLENWKVNGSAWNDLGALHFEQRQYSKARLCFEKAVLLADRKTDYLCNLANVCIETGSKREALRLLVEVLKRNPLDLRAACLMGFQLDDQTSTCSVEIGKRLQVTRLTLFSGGEKEQNWTSRVEDFSPRSLRISIPTAGWRNMPLRRGTRMILGYTTSDALWGTIGEVIGFVWENIPLLEIQTAPTFRRIQRRSNFRISRGTSLFQLNFAGAGSIRFEEENISATGAGVIVWDPVEPGSVVFMDIEVGGMLFNIEGRVIRQMPIPKKGYRLGIAFTDMDEIKRERLARHIHHAQLEWQKIRIR